MTAQPSNRLNLIQLSRALVPLMVMTFHLSESIYGYYEFSFMSLHELPISGGVNFFFALSGFMMFYLYKDKLTKRSEWKPFILNRAIRIYPLYWIITINYLLFWFFFHENIWGNSAFDTQSMITSIFLIPVPNQSDPYLIVAWSLVFTVFFYLMFSFSFLLSRQKIIIFYSIWAFLSIAFYSGMIDLNVFPIHFIFSLSSLIFMAGMLAGFIVSRSLLNIKTSMLLIAAGILMFPFTWVNYLHDWFYVDFDFSTGLASFLLIIGLASIDIQVKLQLPAFLNMLGNAAFSIYLFHNTVLDLTMEYFYQLGFYNTIGAPGIMMLIFIIMILSGVLVYHFMEKPLVKILRLFLTRSYKRTTHLPPEPKTA
ncbi:acyltransferase family protein [Jeotgalibacillus sp. JSM ZJ347]|uniref:acyltransferase family protein n=1 Tax=Jeotgalibacillus sp. JSM ZJ347 TaxID=3342117 RepID=UPI0035A91347